MRSRRGSSPVGGEIVEQSPSNGRLTYPILVGADQYDSWLHRSLSPGRAPCMAELNRVRVSISLNGRARQLSAEFGQVSSALRCQDPTLYERRTYLQHESSEHYRRVRQAKGRRACAHSHDASACTDGAAPVAGLIADRAGNLYGTTAAGRASKALRRGRSNSHLGVFSHSQAILELRREVIARGEACTVPAAPS